MRNLCSFVLAHHWKDIDSLQQHSTTHVTTVFCSALHCVVFGEFVLWCCVSFGNWNAVITHSAFLFNHIHRHHQNDYFLFIHVQRRAPQIEYACVCDVWEMERTVFVQLYDSLTYSRNRFSARHLIVPVTFFVAPNFRIIPSPAPFR